MPYRIQQTGQQWCVMRQAVPGGNETQIRCHPTQLDATTQMRALQANETNRGL